MCNIVSGLTSLGLSFPLIVHIRGHASCTRPHRSDLPSNILWGYLSSPGIDPATFWSRMARYLIRRTRTIHDVHLYQAIDLRIYHDTPPLQIVLSEHSSDLFTRKQISEELSTMDDLLWALFAALVSSRTVSSTSKNKFNSRSDRKTTI